MYSTLQKCIFFFFFFFFFFLRLGLSTFHLNFRPIIIILLFFKVWKFSIFINFSHACKILLFLYQWSFRVNSTSDSQVSVSNIAQIIPKITLVSIMKACKILGCNSE